MRNGGHYRAPGVRPIAAFSSGVASHPRTAFVGKHRFDQVQVDTEDPARVRIAFAPKERGWEALLDVEAAAGAAILLTTLSTIVSSLGLAEGWRTIIYGAVIFVALLLLRDEVGIFWQRISTRSKL